MPYNFKISYSITKIYLIALIPIVCIIIAMYIMISWTYKESVEKDKNMQMKNAVQLRMTDIDSWFNDFFELENNFNVSINAFGMINEEFQNKFFQEYIKQKLTDVPEITSFWIWFSSKQHVFFPPTTIDSNFNYSDANGFFMRCYRDKNKNVESTQNDNVYFQKLNTQAFNELIKTAPIAKPQASKEFSLSEPYICDYITGEHPTFIASFSSPILDSKQRIVGVTGFDMKLEDIAKQINGLATNVYTRVCILSKQGFYYSHVTPERLGMHIRKNTIFDNQPYVVDSVLKHAANNTSFSVDIISEGLQAIDTIAKHNTIYFNNLAIKHTKGDYVTTAVFMPKAKFNVDYNLFQQSIYIYSIVTILLTILFIFAIVAICSNVLYNRMYVNFSGLNKDIE